jgi:hypothetical protein
VRSPLKNKIKVTLLGTQTEFDPAEDTPKPIPFDRPGDVPTVRHGDWVFLKIENASPSDLNVAVLDFQPDWGISQVLPLKSSFEEIDSGGEPLVLPLRAWLPDGYDQGSEPLVLPLRAWLPDGYDQGSDTLKILAAVDPADFRVLELPALDQPIAPKGMRGATASSATYCPPSARRNPGRATWKSPRTRARSGRRPRSSSTSSGRPPGPDSPGPTPCGDVTSRPSRGTCPGTEPASRARSTAMSDSIEREPRTNGLEAPDRRPAGPVEVSATRNFASPGVVAAEPPPPQAAKPADEPRAKRPRVTVEVVQGSLTQAEVYSTLAETWQVGTQPRWPPASRPKPSKMPATSPPWNTRPGGSPATSRRMIHATPVPPGPCWATMMAPSERG